MPEPLSRSTSSPTAPGSRIGMEGAPRWRRSAGSVLVVAFVVALGLGACGDSGDDDPVAESGTTTEAASTSEDASGDGASTTTEGDDGTAATTVGDDEPETTEGGGGTGVGDLEATLLTGDDVDGFEPDDEEDDGIDEEGLCDGDPVPAMEWDDDATAVLLSDEAYLSSFAAHLTSDITGPDWFRAEVDRCQGADGMTVGWTLVSAGDDALEVEIRQADTLSTIYVAQVGEVMVGLGIIVDAEDGGTAGLDGRGLLDLMVERAGG